MCTHLPCPFSVIFLVKIVYNTCKTIASVRYCVCQREGNGPAGARNTPEPGPRGGTSWPERSLAHPTRTHLLRITTILWRRTTTALSACAPTPARTVGYSLAT